MGPRPIGVIGRYAAPTRSAYGSRTSGGWRRESVACSAPAARRSALLGCNATSGNTRTRHLEFGSTDGRRRYLARQSPARGSCPRLAQVANVPRDDRCDEPLRPVGVDGGRRAGHGPPDRLGAERLGKELRPGVEFRGGGSDAARRRGGGCRPSRRRMPERQRVPRPARVRSRRRDPATRRAVASRRGDGDDPDPRLRVDANRRGRPRFVGPACGR